MKNIDINLSNYFSEEDISDLNDIEVGGYTLNAKRLPATPIGIGGLVWEGIVIFITGAIAGGFLGAIGQDGYYWLKEKFFNLKSKLKKQAIYKFTINISLQSGGIFFHFTDLNEKDFIDALNKARAAFEENLDYIEKNSGSYDFFFDKQDKRWILSRNKSFDV